MADKPAFNPKAGYDAAKPAFDPNAKTDGIDIPDANAQAHQQLLNATPLGSNPKDIGDKIASAQATGALPPSNPEVDKLAPIVAGGGAAGLAESVLAKVGLAGAGGAVGDAAQQLTTTGKVNPAQAAGAGASMAIGEGVGQTVLSPLAKWISTTKVGGAKLLQAAAEKAASQPVELSPETNKLMEQIMQQDKSGNTAPKVVKDLLARVGPNPNLPADAAPGPLTYPEARDFQSNASRLSAGESMNAKGSMKALMAEFAKSLSGDVQASADAAGVGDIHRMGMQQYATAAGKDKIIDTAKSVAGNHVAQGVGAAGVYELLKKFGVIGGK